MVLVSVFFWFKVFQVLLARLFPIVSGCFRMCFGDLSVFWLFKRVLKLLSDLMCLNCSRVFYNLFGVLV